MLRLLTIITIGLHVFSYLNPSFACEQLNLHLSGQLKEETSILSKHNDATKGLSSVYNLPLKVLGIMNEQARLVFTKTADRIWRVDIQMDVHEKFNSAPNILDRPAATILEFSEEGKQLNSQSLMVFPMGGGSMGKFGTSVLIELDNFELGKNTNLVEEYFLDDKAICAESRTIVSIKTEPNEERDELNPFLPNEQTR